MELKDANLQLNSRGTPRVLFFSGKGGVGKTTLAGTASMRLARSGAKVLVASTDPAHSLSDLFNTQIGREACPVADRVSAIEVDAPFEMGQALDGVGSPAKSGIMGALDDLMTIASRAPGIDEIISLDMLLRLIEQPEYGAVVLDTAPTGHTLRLLALPELMAGYFGKLLRWSGQLSRIGRKLRSIFSQQDSVDIGDLGDELGGAQERMLMLGELLRDPAKCGLVLVTIPEAMSVLETARTMDLLIGQGIPVTAVVVNMIQPVEDGCRFCAERRQGQLVQLERIEHLCDGVPIVQVAYEPQEPRGPDALGALANRIWADADSVLLGAKVVGRG